MYNGPVEYRIIQTTGKGEQLLRDTNLDIPAVAQQSGYASHVRFSTVFREQMGTTPTIYRRKYRAGLS